MAIDWSSLISGWVDDAQQDPSNRQGMDQPAYQPGPQTTYNDYENYQASWPSDWNGPASPSGYSPPAPAQPSSFDSMMGSGNNYAPYVGPYAPSYMAQAQSDPYAQMTRQDETPDQQQQFDFSLANQPPPDSNATVAYGNPAPAQQQNNLNPFEMIGDWARRTWDSVAQPFEQPTKQNMNPFEWVGDTVAKGSSAALGGVGQFFQPVSGAIDEAADSNVPVLHDIANATRTGWEQVIEPAANFWMGTLGETASGLGQVGGDVLGNVFGGQHNDIVGDVGNSLAKQPAVDFAYMALHPEAKAQADANVMQQANQLYQQLLDQGYTEPQARYEAGRLGLKLANPFTEAEQSSMQDFQNLPSWAQLPIAFSSRNPGNEIYTLGLKPLTFAQHVATKAAGEAIGAGARGLADVTGTRPFFDKVGQVIEGPQKFDVGTQTERDKVVNYIQAVALDYGGDTAAAEKAVFLDTESPYYWEKNDIRPDAATKAAEYLGVIDKHATEQAMGKPDVTPQQEVLPQNKVDLARRAQDTSPDAAATLFDESKPAATNTFDATWADRANRLGDAYQVEADRVQAENPGKTVQFDDKQNPLLVDQSGQATPLADPALKRAFEDYRHADAAAQSEGKPVPQTFDQKVSDALNEYSHSREDELRSTQKMDPHPALEQARAEAEQFRPTIKTEDDLADFKARNLPEVKAPFDTGFPQPKMDDSFGRTIRPPDVDITDVHRAVGIPGLDHTPRELMEAVRRHLGYERKAFALDGTVGRPGLRETKPLEQFGTAGKLLNKFAETTMPYMGRAFLNKQGRAIRDTASNILKYVAEGFGHADTDRFERVRQQAGVERPAEPLAMGRASSLADIGGKESRGGFAKELLYHVMNPFDELSGDLMRAVSKKFGKGEIKDWNDFTEKAESKMKSLAYKSEFLRQWDKAIEDRVRTGALDPEIAKLMKDGRLDETSVESFMAGRMPKGASLGDMAKGIYNPQNYAKAVQLRYKDMFGDRAGPIGKVVKEGLDSLPDRVAEYNRKNKEAFDAAVKKIPQNEDYQSRYDTEYATYQQGRPLTINDVDPNHPIWDEMKRDIYKQLDVANAAAQIQESMDPVIRQAVRDQILKSLEYTEKEARLVGVKKVIAARIAAREKSDYFSKYNREAPKPAGSAEPAPARPSGYTQRMPNNVEQMKLQKQILDYGKTPGHGTAADNAIKQLRKPDPSKVIFRYDGADGPHFRVDTPENAGRNGQNETQVWPPRVAEAPASAPSAYATSRDRVLAEIKNTGYNEEHAKAGMAILDAYADAYQARTGRSSAEVYDRISFEKGDKVAPGSLAQIDRNEFIKKMVPEKARENLTEHKFGEVKPPRLGQTISFPKDGKQFVYGKLSPQDWYKRITDWVGKPGSQVFKEARYWYEDLYKKFKDVFGEEDADKYLMAWLVSQQRTEPGRGMTNVLRGNDVMHGGQGVPGGLNRAAIDSLLHEKVPEKGISVKLMDFMDSALQKKTRTWTGNAPDGGKPVAIDVWASRDLGYLDSVAIEQIRQHDPALAVKLLRDKTVESPENPFGPKLDQTEYGNKYYQRVTDWLNSQEIDGGNWEPHQAQALAWMGIQAMFGKPGEGPNDVFEKNTQSLAAETAPGSHSPMSKSLPGYDKVADPVKKAIHRDIMDTAVREAGSMAGVDVVDRVDGAGGYMEDVNPSTTLRVFGSPERIQDFANLLGYGLEQTGVLWSRPLPSGNTPALDIVYKSGSLKLNDLATLDKIWQKAVELEPAIGKRFGFTQLEVGGDYGVRVLMDSKDFAKMRPKVKAALLQAIDEVDPNTKHRTVTSDTRLESGQVTNDWKENPDGREYRETLRARRPSLEAGLDRYSGRVLEAAQKAWETHAPDTFKEFKQGNPDQFVKEAGREPTYAQTEQGTGKRVLGTTTLAANGKYLISIFKDANASTMPHELAHVFRQMLDGDLLKTAEDFAGVTDGKWEVPHEEKFARGFEAYLRKGEAPTPALDAVFKQFREWLVKIYRKITGSEIDVKLTPEIKAVFSKMLGGDPDKIVARETTRLATPAEKAQATPNHPPVEAEPTEMNPGDNGLKPLDEFLMDHHYSFEDGDHAEYLKLKAEWEAQRDAANPPMVTPPAPSRGPDAARSGPHAVVDRAYADRNAGPAKPNNPNVAYNARLPLEKNLRKQAFDNGGSPREIDKVRATDLKSRTDGNAYMQNLFDAARKDGLSDEQIHQAAGTRTANVTAEVKTTTIPNEPKASPVSIDTPWVKGKGADLSFPKPEYRTGKGGRNEQVFPITSKGKPTDYEVFTMWHGNDTADRASDTKARWFVRNKATGETYQGSYLRNGTLLDAVKKVMREKPEGSNSFTRLAQEADEHTPEELAGYDRKINQPGGIKLPATDGTLGQVDSPQTLRKIMAGWNRGRNAGDLVSDQLTRTQKLNYMRDIEATDEYIRSQTGNTFKLDLDNFTPVRISDGKSLDELMGRTRQANIGTDRPQWPAGDPPNTVEKVVKETEDYFGKDARKGFAQLKKEKGEAAVTQAFSDIATRLDFPDPMNVQVPTGKMGGETGEARKAIAILDADARERYTAAAKNRAATSAENEARDQTRASLETHLYHNMAGMVKDADTAAYKKVEGTYFDYRNKNVIDQALGSLLPFNYWSRRNFAYVAKYFANNPVQFAAILQFYKNVEQENQKAGGIASYNMGNILLWSNPDGSKVQANISSFFPFNPLGNSDSLMQLIDANDAENGDTVNKTPLAFLFGADRYYNGKLTGRDKGLLPTFLSPNPVIDILLKTGVPNDFAKKLGIVTDGFGSPDPSDKRGLTQTTGLVAGRTSIRDIAARTGLTGLIRDQLTKMGIKFTDLDLEAPINELLFGVNSGKPLTAVYQELTEMAQGDGKNQEKYLFALAKLKQGNWTPEALKALDTVEAQSAWQRAASMAGFVSVVNNTPRQQLSNQLGQIYGSVAGDKGHYEVTSTDPKTGYQTKKYVPGASSKFFDENPGATVSFDKNKSPDQIVEGIGNSRTATALADLNKAYYDDKKISLKDYNKGLDDLKAGNPTYFKVAKDEAYQKAKGELPLKPGETRKTVGDVDTEYAKQEIPAERRYAEFKDDLFRAGGSERWQELSDQIDAAFKKGDTATAYKIEGTAEYRDLRDARNKVIDANDTLADRREKEDAARYGTVPKTKDDRLYSEWKDKLTDASSSGRYQELSAQMSAAYDKKDWNTYNAIKGSAEYTQLKAARQTVLDSNPTYAARYKAENDAKYGTATSSSTSGSGSGSTGSSSSSYAPWTAAQKSLYGRLLGQGYSKAAATSVVDKAGPNASSGSSKSSSSKSYTTTYKPASSKSSGSSTTTWTAAQSRLYGQLIGKGYSKAAAASVVNKQGSTPTSAAPKTATVSAALTTSKIPATPTATPGAATSSSTWDSVQKKAYALALADGYNKTYATTVANKIGSGESTGYKSKLTGAVASYGAAGKPATAATTAPKPVATGLPATKPAATTAATPALPAVFWTTNAAGDKEADAQTMHDNGWSAGMGGYATYAAAKKIAEQQMAQSPTQVRVVVADPGGGFTIYAKGYLSLSQADDTLLRSETVANANSAGYTNSVRSGGSRGGGGGSRTSSVRIHPPVAPYRVPSPYSGTLNRMNKGRKF